MSSGDVGSVSQAKLLLVDNDPDVRAILQQCIEMRGHACSFACDGQDGLEQIQQALLCAESQDESARRIDAVLLDLRMPRLDGRALLEELRPWCEERGLLARAPRFVVVSGFIGAEDREFLETEGLVARIFKKPFDFVELLDAVEEALAAGSAPVEHARGDSNGDSTGASGDAEGSAGAAGSESGGQAEPPQEFACEG